MMFNQQRRLGMMSIALVAVMVCMLLFNVLIGGKVDLRPTDFTEQTVSATSNSFERSDVDMSSLREELFNEELVQRDIASYDGEQWVIVELEGTNLYDAYKTSGRYGSFTDYEASYEGKRLRSSIELNQQSFLAKLDKHGIEYTYKYSYYTINNGVALKVNADAYNAIKKMSGVKDVYYSESYDMPKVEVVHNDAHVYTTGIYDTKKLKSIDTDGDEVMESYQGQGMVVAILDTGLDYTHPAFLNPVESPRWSKESLAEILSDIRGRETFYAVGSVDELYRSTKVPFMYDYADDDPDVYPSNNSHGTHVAGIVAGQDDDKVVNPDTGETFIGVAPQAQLAIFKVFSDQLDNPARGGANSVDILRALNDCVKLGVDVINMSLGSSAGFTDVRSDNFMKSIYNSIEEAGISLVVAGSNDFSSGYGGDNGTNLASNPDSGTVGSPGTYEAALSVASINGQMSRYIQAIVSREDESKNPIAFITNSSDQYGNELDFIRLLLEKYADKVQDGKLLMKYVVVPGVGLDNNYNAQVTRELNSLEYRGQGGTVDVAGTIAFIKRGNNTFAEKVKEAKRAGADACVIYNNVSGIIRMSLGEVEDPLPSCSITMDAAKSILDNTRGITGLIEISLDKQAGPFMSEFSSWGPTPDLQIKPEITAHGGEITSSVAGGAYEIESGTSMASPNMAGAVALLRQFLQSKTELTGRALEARANQLLMSTATIARNEEGNPYSPRKQGAGLANIENALLAEAYLTVGEYGSPLDKTKLELGDDPDKDGVYHLNFNLINTSNAPQTYRPLTYVMTETMATDNKTVAEKATVFATASNDYADIVYKVNGTTANGDITVGVGEHLSIEVTVTLKQPAREYLDSRFENGMYVEGFVKFENTNGGVTLNVPYLAFYGDWNDAPLFDYDIYEISESEADDNIEDEDKLKVTAAATQVVGSYYDDEMILPLGTYVYAQDEDEVEVYPSKDKLAVSRYDSTSDRTIYEIYAIWAGLLRNAAYMDLIITNRKTGELVYEHQIENVSKAYAGGGSGRGAIIPMELKPAEWGMQNNEEYNVLIRGQLDYQNDTDPKAQNPNKNSFEFHFAVDYEAPQLLGYRVRYVPYEENKVTKYRIYMDFDVYDNQYIMDVIPAYLEDDMSRWSGGTRDDGTIIVPKTLRIMTEYPIPVSNQQGKMTTVTVEVTDFYEDYVREGEMYLQVEDYAMNNAVYRILLDQDVLSLDDEVDFITDGKLVLPKGQTSYVDDFGERYDQYSITLRPNEVYKINTSESIDNLEKYTWRYAFQNNNAGDKVIAKGSEIFAKELTGDHPVIIYLTDGRNGYDAAGTYTADNERIYAAIEISVEDTPLATPEVESISIRPVKTGDGNIVSVSGEEIELNPNMEIQLALDLSPWYSALPSGVSYTTSNPNVITVDDSGLMKTHSRGAANVTVTALGIGNGRIKATLRATVGEEFDVSNYTLTAYYGGKDVVIPDDLNIMYMDEYTFRYNTEIETVKLPSTLLELPEGAFIGCENLREITIPGQCLVVGIQAFANCVNLQKVTFLEYEDSKHNVQDAFGSLTVGYMGFANCRNLTTFELQKRDGTTLSGWDRITTLFDLAFTNCTSLRSIDISSLRVTGSSVFSNCTNLQEVTTSEDTALGSNMFEGCTSLTEFEIKSNRVPVAMFAGCDHLENVTFTTDSMLSIGALAFKNTAITSLQLPGGYYSIGADAFGGAPLTTLTLSANTRLDLTAPQVTTVTEMTSDSGQPVVSMSVEVSPFVGSNISAFAFATGTNNYYDLQDGVLYEKDSSYSKLVLMPPQKTDFSLAASVTSIGDIAMAGTALTSIDLSHVTEVGKYAFAQSKLQSVTLPDAMTEIPEGMLFNCPDFTTLANGGSVEKIGANAFALCTALTAFDFASVTEIGAGAFQGAASLSTVTNVGQIVRVGDNAFERAALTEVNFPNMQYIGRRAFADMKTAVIPQYDDNGTLESVTSASGSLITVVLGNIKEFGEFAFSGNYSLASVRIGYGTTEIPRGAFEIIYDEGDGLIVRCGNLSSLTLPDTVQTIGERAFVGAKINTVNLSGVKTIGERAFAHNTNLRMVALNNVEYIGAYAFYSANVSSANLENAKYIGEYAFIGNGSLTTVNVPKAEFIGESAFEGHRATTITIPSTLGRTYNYYWDEFDEKGNVSNMQDSTADSPVGAKLVRKMSSLGGNAIGDSATLENIFVEGTFTETVTKNGVSLTARGNEDFVSVDGVLYERLFTYTVIDASEREYYTSRGMTVGQFEDTGRYYVKEFEGYKLVQYPSGKRDSSYRVIDKTVSIGDYAFMGDSNLRTVTLPYSVKEIGVGAFMNTAIVTYEFESVEAPTLISAYNDDLYSISVNSIKEYYNNFIDKNVFIYLDYLSSSVLLDWARYQKVIGTVRDDILNILGSAEGNSYLNALYSLCYEFYTGEPQSIRAIIKNNATGYDSPIWQSFFGSGIARTADDGVDTTTQKAKDLIDSLPTAESIQSVATYEELMAVGGVSEQLAAARAAYDLISDPIQLGLASAQYDKLISLEYALRERLKQLGHPVNVQEVTPTGTYSTNYSIGQRFDPTGLQLKVLFENGSQIIIAGDSGDITFSDIIAEVEKFGDNGEFERTRYYVDAKWTDENGKQWTIRIVLNVSGDAAVQSGGGTKFGTGAIVGIAVGCSVAVAAGIAVAVALLLMKKKGKLGAPAGSSDPETPANDDAQADDAQADKTPAESDEQ